MFCGKCRVELVKNVDRTPGARRAWYECECEDKRPSFGPPPRPKKKGKAAA